MRTVPVGRGIPSLTVWMFYLCNPGVQKIYFFDGCLVSLPRYRGEHSYCFFLYPFHSGDRVAAGRLTADPVVAVRHLGSFRLFSGEGFNASVLYHLRSETAGVAIAEYSGILALTVLLTVGTFVSVWVLLRYLGSKAGSNNSAKGWLLLLAMLGTVTLHPTVNGFLAMFNRGFYGDTSVADIAGEDFDAFYSAPQFTSVDGNKMNLVLLYAESIEQTYFD